MIIKIGTADHKHQFISVLLRFLTICYLAYNPFQVSAQCSGNNFIQDPTQFQWTYHPVTTNNPVAYYSGTLEVGQATFTMNNGQTLTTRAYRQKDGVFSIPGPTIKVQPGNKYILRFNNTLPYQPLSVDENVYKDPNVSNIHTHGLHISGTTPGDDVSRSFEGGRGGDFVWDIPANHMGGTYWYHAHHHGSSFLQVSGGLFGMLIVDDSKDNIPVPVAAMEERQIILGYLDRGAAGSGGDVLLSGSLTSTWTVNGKIKGNICLPANTWQHWRILMADRDATMKTVTFGPECEVMLLARDGVWRTVAPKALGTRTLDLTGASRADIAIRLKGTTSTLNIAGATVATITASGITNATPHPFNTDGVSTWSAVRPSYLRDLRAVTNVHKESVTMGARTINGVKYNHHTPNLTLAADQTQEWAISGAGAHPFHLHIYHIQALANDVGFEAGEYYDVLASKMSVRFDLNSNTSTAYSGRTIMHCHILSHEDQGAMGWVNVTGGQGAPTFPVNGDLTEPYSAYYYLGSPPPAAPSNLTATVVSNSTIGLNWTDNSTDETGFRVERSTDGMNFTFVADVGSNTISYVSSGLFSGTTYYHRVSSFNGTNNSNLSTPSNVASTTLPSGGGVEMHVGSIVVTRVAQSGGRTSGVANVYIYDASNAPLSGVTVTGTFSGPTTGTFSGTTNASGQVTYTSASVKSPVGSWCFQVTGVVKTGVTYNQSANVMTTSCEGGAAMSMTSMSDHDHGDVTLTSEHDFRFMIYPNPLPQASTIDFHLPYDERVIIEIYNLQGDRLATVVNEIFAAGDNQITVQRQNLKAGVYFISFSAGGKTTTRRLIFTD